MTRPLSISLRCSRCSKKLTGYDFYCLGDRPSYCVECKKLMCPKPKKEELCFNLKPIHEWHPSYKPESSRKPTKKDAKKKLKEVNSAKCTLEQIFGKEIMDQIKRNNSSD